MKGAYTRIRQWEADLIWIWDRMLDAERGQCGVPASTLASAAVEAVRAHLSDAAPSGPSRRGAAASTARPATE